MVSGNFCVAWLAVELSNAAVAADELAELEAPNTILECCRGLWKTNLNESTFNKSIV